MRLYQFFTLNKHKIWWTPFLSKHNLSIVFLFLVRALSPILAPSLETWDRLWLYLLPHLQHSDCHPVFINSASETALSHILFFFPITMVVHALISLVYVIVTCDFLPYLWNPTSYSLLNIDKTRITSLPNRFDDSALIKHFKFLYLKFST